MKRLTLLLVSLTLSFAISTGGGGGGTVNTDNFTARNALIDSGLTANMATFHNEIVDNITANKGIFGSNLGTPGLPVLQVWTTGNSSNGQTGFNLWTNNGGKISSLNVYFDISSGQWTLSRQLNSTELNAINTLYAPVIFSNTSQGSRIVLGTIIGSPSFILSKASAANHTLATINILGLHVSGNITANSLVVNAGSVPGFASINVPVYFGGIGAAGTGTDLVLNDNKQVIPKTSSLRFKKDISLIPDATSEKIYSLTAKQFKYKGYKDKVTKTMVPSKEESINEQTKEVTIKDVMREETTVTKEEDPLKNNGHSYGYIAEETEPILPDTVISDAGGPYSIKYSEIIPLITQEMKKLRDRIVDLEKRIDVLEGK